MFIQDLPYIINWWLMFFVIGLINLPISWTIFRKFTGAGYGLSKSLGILLVSYLTFLLGTFHLAKFTYATVVAILLFILIINLYIFVKKKDEILSSIKNSWIFILIEETFFTFGLVFWSYVRGHQPDIRGL
jgi:CHASE2 domain-containing sensor protein